MKNNEILISVKFVSQKTDGKNRKSFSDCEMSFLVLKDITLRALIEGLYYGLKRQADAEKKKTSGQQQQIIDRFVFFEDYIKMHDQLLVLYTSMGDYANLKITDKRVDTFDDQEKMVYDCKLCGLGIVTGSCIYITDAEAIDTSNQVVRALFDKQKIAQMYMRDEKNALQYNISTRRLNVIEPFEIEILPAGDMPKGEKRSFLDIIIPLAISTGGSVGARFATRLLSDSQTMNDAMMIMMFAMPAISLVNTVYNYIKQGKNQKQSVAEWKENYENYINNTIIKRIVEWQRTEIKYLKLVYPEMDKLFEQTSSISPVIFSRSQSDNDFMKITLGTSEQIRPMFEIKAEKKDNIFYDVRYRLVKDENSVCRIVIELPDKKRKKSSYDMSRENLPLLTELAYNFANKSTEGEETRGFKYLCYHGDTSNQNRKPPLLVDLKSCGALGVISDNAEISQRFVRHLAFELAFYHSPEDLQMVFFFDKESDKNVQARIVENYKFLPHTNELLENTSQFIFDKASAGEVFSQLQTILSSRTRKQEDEEKESAVQEKVTQIVCFVFCDYDIKESAFSKFLPEVPKEGEEYVNENGLTFVFVQEEKGKLPKYCGNIVELDGGKRIITNRYNVLSRETLQGMTFDSEEETDHHIEKTHFDNMHIFHDVNDEKVKAKQFSLAYRQLSSIYSTRIAENGKVPSMVTLFELYPFLKDHHNNDQTVREEIKKRWKHEEPYDKFDVTRDLRVEMGKNEHDVTYLDLHENADGPHMLVAGTTGSGKSETIITYLIGLCLKYSPMDLNLLLVDMKGGGFSDRLGNLPHCVGAVTDTAGENEGISAVYMLKRFLESLNAEIKRRKLILQQLDVDNVDAYIRTYRKIQKAYTLKDSTKAEDIKKRKELLEELLPKQRDSEKWKKRMDAIENGGSELKPLSHLVLVVDEFTELKRFSSEANDIDFIAEITTIARVGRTLGLHIILVSQNIEGAINDDIRVNTKSKICLKVATKQASKEMLGTTDAAAATMPGHGRAYILVGTGSRYEYFQSAYTGANKNINIEPNVNLTFVPDTGSYDKRFYNSDKDNEILKERRKTSETTQLEYAVEQICELAKDFEKPKKVFMDPLATCIDEKVDAEQWKGVDDSE